MPRRPSSSLHWLTLAVVLPLLLLAAVAWWGTHSQLKAAWAEAREEAERMAPLLAQSLTEDLQASMKTIRIYPDPPVPGTLSELDAILDGDDLGALESLRDNPHAGLSPAGLPRRALAALRLCELDRLRQPDQILANLLTQEAPSILTQPAMKRFHAWGNHLTKTAWLEDEEVRPLAAQVHDPKGSWFSIADGNRYAFVRRGDDSLSYVRMSGGQLAAVEHQRGLPRWAFTHVHTGDSKWPVLATAPIGLGKGMMLSISPFGYGLTLEEPIRRQQRWIFTMLAVSVVTAATALVILHRTLRRERKLNEMKSQFVASVSHELRAPVASIRLMADALEAEKVPPETAKEFHRLIAREGARLSTLVGNVLDHARIEQGRKVWKMEPCDLSSLVADTVRVMEPLAHEKGIGLKVEFSAVEAAVDADAIQQALVNLLDNAIKFSPTGTTVTTLLALDEESHSWRLSVRDEGPGIPKEEQSRIFERFYRPGDELRRETQGTGIGLSLVKSIAEAHRGKVIVDSETGHGSTFTLVIPIGSSSTDHLALSTQ
jgi:signal transduction histidine kinase